MQRDDLKAFIKLNQLIKPLLTSRVNFYIISYGLFFSYLATQKAADKLCRLFWQKTETNPSPKSWVNNNFHLDKSEVDHKLYRCTAKVNYHDLGYVHQRRIFDCGDAAIAMLLQYEIQKGKDCPEKVDYDSIIEFANKFNNRKINLLSGKDTDEVRCYSDHLMLTDVRKLKDNMDVETFAYYLYRHGPIIASIKELGGHFLVIKGIVDDQVILHDPWSGPNLVFSFNDFKKMWDGTFIYFLNGYSKELESPSESNILNLK